MSSIHSFFELAPSKGLFGPEDLARMSIAYEAALIIADERDSPFSILSRDDLRLAIARAVMRDARNGIVDVHVLKAQALRALIPLVVCAQARLFVQPNVSRH